MTYKIKKNKFGKDYVVGDIHGCFDKLQQALDEMGFNPQVDRLFAVGDLVDRGPNSEACLDWIYQPWFYAVRGNHEQMAIDALEGFYEPSNYVFNGGAWFIEKPKAEKEEFVEAFKGLPLYLTVETDAGDVGFIHGDAPTDWNYVDKHNPHWALWGRSRHARKDTSLVKNIHKVYVGHTPVKEKLVYGNVHFVDTGAVFGRAFHIEDISG